MTLLTRIDANPMLTMRERSFAPIVLAPFADDMARRMTRLSMGPLLEIAGGAGVLTQAMAAALSAGLTIIATDPDPEMVSHASHKPGMARVTWQQADPSALPFHDTTFGIVVCHFAIATISDRVRVFREARRVLKQNGRFVFSVPAHLRHNPVAACLQGALDACFPTDPPQFLAHGLHGYADNETIDDDLTAAGFTDAIYTTVDLPFAAPSAADAARAYCLGTPLRSELERLAHGDTEPLLRAATQALSGRFGPGPIETTMRGYIVSAAG